MSEHLLALYLGDELGEAHPQRLRYPVEVDDPDVALRPISEQEGKGV